MRAGRLDRKITIQRKAVTLSATGAQIETWSAIKHRYSASVGELKGDERFVDPQWLAKEKVVFRIRWSQAIATLNPQDRVLYPPPADQDEQNPAFNTIYEVMAVHEIGRREGLQIKAARRADVTT